MVIQEDWITMSKRFQNQGINRNFGIKWLKVSIFSSGMWGFSHSVLWRSLANSAISPPAHMRFEGAKSLFLEKWPYSAFVCRAVRFLPWWGSNVLAACTAERSNAGRRDKPIQKHLSKTPFSASFLNHLAMLEQHLKPTPSPSLLLELSGLIQSL